MGGIIGAGIFVNPAEVARHVHTPRLIVGVWLLGGLIAIAGALVYAELADRRPDVGGQYAYLRDAFGPDPGLPLWLVAAAGDPVGRNGGGRHHLRPLFPRPCAACRCPKASIAAAVLVLLLVAINCLGVRAGGTVQSGLMVLKIVAIAHSRDRRLVVRFGPSRPCRRRPVRATRVQLGLLAAIGAAMTPVMFAYGGWQTSSFVAGEMRNPRRDLVAGTAAGRRRCGDPLYGGRLRLRLRAWAGRTGAIQKRRRPTRCDWRWARPARRSLRLASPFRRSAFSAREC